MTVPFMTISGQTKRQTVQGTLTARLGERKVRARNLMIGAFVES
jgi:hypothetical protein